MRKAYVCALAILAIAMMLTAEFAAAASDDKGRDPDKDKKDKAGKKDDRLEPRAAIMHTQEGIILDISDFGERVNFTVETFPDRGSGSGTEVSNGRYLIAVDDSEGDFDVKAIVSTETGSMTESELFLISDAGWYDDRFDYRRSFTISPTQATIEDFPLLIQIDDHGMMEKINADGSDILFTDSDGITVLPFEIEHIGGGSLTAWVRLPELSSTQDTVLYMYYGDPGAASMSDASAVWEEYLAVYHLDETSGAVVDSTGSYDGTALNGVSTGATGVADGCYSFDGVNDRIQLPRILEQSTYTIEAWAFSDPTRGYIVSQRDPYNHGGFVQYYGPSSEFQMYYDSRFIRAPAASLEWHHVVGTFDGTVGRLYVDGALISQASGSITWPDSPTYIGDRVNGGRYFSGRLDEIRISDNAKGLDFIRASFQNQQDPGSFYTVGEEEQASGVPAISAVYPAEGEMNVPLSPTLSATLTDPEDGFMNWTIDIWMGEAWMVLGRGDGNSPITASAIADMVDENSALYTWRITVEDQQGLVSSVTSTFTTKPSENLPPMITDPDPGADATGVSLDPTLSATVRDPDGDDVSWSLQIRSGYTWDTIGTGTIEGTGTAQAEVDDLAESTYYRWRVTASDPEGSGEEIRQEFNFTTMSVDDAPVISDPYPENSSVDIPLDPELRIDISDPEGQPITWRIDLYTDSWATISSGTDPDGIVTVYAGTEGVDRYDSTYYWRVTASDTMHETVAQYSFRTKTEENPPAITNPSPADDATAVALLSAMAADITDPEGGLLDITFRLDDGTGWRTIRTWNDQPSGRFSVSGTAYVTQPYHEYDWRITATDSEGDSTEQTFSFMTRGLLQQKFRITIGNSAYGQIIPVMGDIDDDGTQEIVMVAGYNVVAVNGRTGQIEWNRSGAVETSPELADLNRDGTPEVLYGMNGPRLRALNGDGSIRWTSQEMGGDGQSLFPIASHDIDGDGYAEIYFASEDTSPSTWSGDISDYDGAVTKLDHQGNILDSTWLLHPCWGGIAIADVDFDGDYELYVSDRREGYPRNFPGKGLQAYDADTLDLLWNKPGMQHSSPHAVIADVFGDDDLEIVAQPITIMGPVVLDEDGDTIADYSNRRLPTHGTATVHDIDNDGNQEAIMATGYPDNAPMNFVVFDLVDGTLDHEENFSYHLAWPPKVGDVTGDGNMEILAATGNQGSTRDYPLIVYDSGYRMIDYVDVRGMGQLMPVLVADTDSDGYNEVVLIGMKGIMVVYDTPARTPDPAPNTWYQFYSQYRRGASEYVPPPGER